MIAKTTSSLPLSYSLYTKFETETRYNVVLEGEEEGLDKEDSGFFGFFSSSSKKKRILNWFSNH